MLGGKSLRLLLTELFTVSPYLWYKTVVGLEKRGIVRESFSGQIIKDFHDGTQHISSADRI